MKWRATDLNDSQIRHLALKCPIKLPQGNGPVKVPADSGDWLAYPAKTEVTKKYRKRCIEDLRQRELRGGSYKGDVGHCVIGGKKFSLYPKSGMLMRDDFALWCEANAEKHLDPFGRPRKVEAPERDETVTVDTQLKIWKDIRARAMKLPAVTDLLAEDMFLEMYRLKEQLAHDVLRMRAEKKTGNFYSFLKVDADVTASIVALKEKKWSDAIDFMLEAASALLVSARFVQERHGAAPKEGS